MSQSVSGIGQTHDWTDTATYLPFLQADRRTWAWLWLNRSPLFQQGPRQMEVTEWSQHAGSVILVENLCRHF